MADVLSVSRGLAVVRCAFTGALAKQTESGPNEPENGEGTWVRYAVRHDDHVHGEKKDTGQWYGNHDRTNLADQCVGDECDATDRQTPKDDPVDCISHKLIFSRISASFNSIEPLCLHNQSRRSSHEIRTIRGSVLRAD